VEPADSDSLSVQLITEAFEQLLGELAMTRQREGASLGLFLQQRIDDMAYYFQSLKERLPEVESLFRMRLKTRFNEAQLTVDPERLEQETLLLLQKMDVAEELHRAETHLAEITRVIEEGGVVGRKLDFLIQELYREVNTLGSKSVDGKWSQWVIDMKVLVEQMREQVQNLE
jgi:uncharacterized protein (TIGR00255 family)